MFVHYYKNKTDNCVVILLSQCEQVRRYLQVKCEFSMYSFEHVPIGLEENKELSVLLLSKFRMRTFQAE